MDPRIITLNAVFFLLDNVHIFSIILYGNVFGHFRHLNEPEVANVQLKPWAS